MRSHDTPSSWRSGRWPSMVKGVEPWVRRICLSNEDGAGIVGVEPRHRWGDQPGWRLVEGDQQAGEEGLREGIPWGDPHEELPWGSLGYGRRVGGGHPQEEPGRRGGDRQWDGVECRSWGRVEAVLSVGRGVKGECVGSRRWLSGWPIVVGHREEGRLTQKCPHQDSAAVRCVRVRIEEVRSQSKVVREDGKSTLGEARVVVCEKGTAGAFKETEEERRVVTVEERAGVKKETSDSTAGTTATCDICRVPQRLLRRHIELMHLPWFFRPENRCWKCQWAECSSLHLEKRHWKCHDEEGKFTDQRLATWCESVKAILVLLARQLG